MSRSFWRCRNPACPVRGGAVLGRATAVDGLVLDPDIQILAVYLDTRKAVITCPACGMKREYRGTAILLVRD